MVKKKVLLTGASGSMGSVAFKELLKRMKYTFPLVVVKINDKVIPRSDFSEITVPNNSKVAVVHMISGG